MADRMTDRGFQIIPDNRTDNMVRFRDTIADRFAAMNERYRAKTEVRKMTGYAGADVRFYNLQAGRRKIRIPRRKKRRW